MIHMTRYAFGGAAIILLTISVGYYSYWYHVAEKAKNTVLGYVALGHGQGHSISYDTLVVEGFPYLIRMKIKDLQWRSALRKAQWEGSEAVVEMQPWDVWRYHITLPGRHRVKILQSVFGEQLVFEPREATALIRFHADGGLAESVLNISALRLSGSKEKLLASANKIVVNLEHPKKSEIGLDKALLSISSMIEGLKFPNTVSVALGESVRSLQFAAHMKRALPKGFHREHFVRWQAAGGFIDLSWFQIGLGPLDLKGHGLVGLDQKLRPVLSAVTNIRGFVEAVNALENSKILKPELAASMHLAFAALSKTSPTDGEKVLSIPLNTRKGRLWFGPFSLYKLDPLNFLPHSG